MSNGKIMRGEKMQLKLQEHNLPGKLITFCGLDGSGKTTMIRKLTEKLEENGVNPFLTKQPTKAMRKTEIFRTYMDCEDHSRYAYRSLSLMAAADRIQHTEMEIVPKMEQGGWIISDRYFYSCLANLRARGYTNDKWIYEIGEQIIKPTVSIFMDIPVETAVERVRQRLEEKERYIDIELQYRLREEYLQIAEDVGGVVVPAALSLEKCFSEIWRIVQNSCMTEKDVSNNKMEAKIADLIKKNAPSKGEINEQMHMKKDLGMNSLRRTQLICDIEEAFGFEFDFSDLNPCNFRYVKDVYTITKKYVNV